MFQRNKITGIILCGGKSSRMGQNKALLKIGKKHIISYVIDTIRPFCDELILSSNTSELDFLGLRTVNDQFQNIGPIAGIYSALMEAKNEVNIIMSCDTPFINNHLIKDLLSASKNHDIVLPEFNGHLQPMTGVFKKSCLPLIEREINKGNYIPPKIFEQTNLNKIRISNADTFYHKYLFFNVNIREDFSQAQEIMKKIKD